MTESDSLVDIAYVAFDDFLEVAREMQDELEQIRRQSSQPAQDVEAYNRFVRSKYKPTADKNLNFFDEYPYWSVWILQKT